MARKALRETPVLPEHRDLRGLKVLWDPKVLQDHRASLGNLDQKEKKANLENPERRERKDNLERLGNKESMDLRGAR